jgi:hypothetical protein
VLGVCHSPSLGAHPLNNRCALPHLPVSSAAHCERAATLHSVVVVFEMILTYYYFIT